MKEIEPLVKQKVKEIDFIPQFEPLVKQKYIDAVTKQLETGWLGPHKTVEKFEQKVAEICGVKYCISTTSGTVALIMAIKSSVSDSTFSTLPILFPAYTFLAGANAAKFMGYSIKLIDVRYQTLCMDSRIVAEDRFHFSSIIFVNHNGYFGQNQQNDIEVLKSICKDRSVPLIEDTSQSLGMFQQLIGDVGIISFSVPKIITTGQGGAVITNDQRIYEQCLAIRDHGGNNWKKTKTHIDIGVNFKFNDILASYGLSQLEDIEQLLQIRDEIFKWYKEEGVELVTFGYPSTWMAIYRAKDAEKLIRRLREHNIGAEQYYKPIHYNLPYNTYEKFPVAERLYNELVYLPSSLTLTKDIVKRICKIIKKVDATITSSMTPIESTNRKIRNGNSGEMVKENVEKSSS